MRGGVALVLLLASGSTLVASGCGRVGFGALDARTDAIAESADGGAPDATLDAATPEDAPLPDGPDATLAPDAGADGGLDAPDCGTAFTDADGDGFGVEASARSACDPLPAGLVRLAGDCDDSRPDTYSGAPESCDGVDEDCDAMVDEGACDGSVVRVVVTGLTKNEAWRRVDVDPLGRLLVLGGRGGAGTAAVELRSADGAPVATFDLEDGPHAEQWVRGLSSGFVVGSPTYLRRYDAAGARSWGRVFTGTGSWAQYAPVADDGQILIAGEQLGAVDVGTGPLPWNSVITSLVASYDPTTGAPRYVRRHEGGATTGIASSPDGAYTSGYFAIGPVDYGDGLPATRPLFVAALDRLGGLVAEWRSMRAPSLDEAVVGLERLADGDVVFVADFEGGDFEGTSHPTSRSALVVRFTWTTGAVLWSRAFVGAFTNDAVPMDSGGSLVCMSFALDSAPIDWGAGVTTSSAGPTVLCLDARTGATRFAFESPGSRDVAVGPSGLVYSAGPAAVGVPLEVTIRR
jgi:hypothetical protein